MLPIGADAPDFTLPDHEGTPRTLRGLLADGPIVLYFYPADFTPVCTAQACTMRDLESELSSAGLRVVGVSPQSPQSHAKFRDKFRLPFVLLSDEKKSAVRAYGADGPLGIGVRRVTYLLGRDGVVRDALRADLRISRHTDFIRSALDALAT
jgi:peroxiredoxin Q/BCP